MNEINLLELRELNATEISSVSGAGDWWDNYEDAMKIRDDLIRRLAEALCDADPDCL